MTSSQPRSQRTFVISGLVSVQLPLRWLGLFAQRDMLPLAVELRHAGDRIHARIVQDALDDWQTSVLLEKMRAIPETESANVAG